MKTFHALLLAAGCAATAHAQFLQDLMPPDKRAVQNVGEIKLEAAAEIVRADFQARIGESRQRRLGVFDNGPRWSRFVL